MALLAAKAAKKMKKTQSLGNIMAAKISSMKWEINK